MKIIRHVLYLLCVFILLLSTVNAHGDLFVRSTSYISNKDHVMAVCLHVKLQSPSSVVIIQQKEAVSMGFMVNCSHWHAWEFKLAQGFINWEWLICESLSPFAMQRCLTALRCLWSFSTTVLRLIISTSGIEIPGVFEYCHSPGLLPVRYW